MTEEQVNAIIAHAEYLVSQDETELGIKALELVPAKYRDVPHPELVEYKALIQSRVQTVYDLLGDWREMPKDIEHCVNYLNATARGVLLREELAKANTAGVVPHIVDMGPGDFCFPRALNTVGGEFTYEPLTLNKEAHEDFAAKMGEKFWSRPLDPAAPKWFVAYEIIEHLADINEILGAQRRYAPNAAKIFLSTPKYTYSQGTPNWQTEGIHHRRAYTPGEFVTAAKSLFPERNWAFVDNEVMCLISTN